MPGCGGALDAGRGVDEVAGDHALALRADVDRRLAGEHADARLEPGRPDLGAERLDRRDEVERGAHRALGVVLLRDRCAPHGHHRVADELLDGSAVALDQPAGALEVARQQVAHVLGVARLGERREADEVGEEHRDVAPLGDRRDGRGAAAGGQRRAALAAEDVARNPHGLPHAGQRSARPAPQLTQNFLPWAFSALQAGHRMSFGPYCRGDSGERRR